MAKEQTIMGATLENIEFFGKNERHPTQDRPRSPKPAWYFKTHLENLEETIRMIRQQLKDGNIPESRIPQQRENLRKNEDKLREIVDSMPKINDMQVEKMAQVWRELGKKISETLYTNDEMRKGLADAHSEADRMMLPCIEVSGDAFYVVKACGAQYTGSGNKAKISRTDAVNAWQIVGRILNEETNPEYLRKE